MALVTLFRVLAWLGPCLFFLVDLFLSHDTLTDPEKVLVQVGREVTLVPVHLGESLQHTRSQDPLTSSTFVVRHIKALQIDAIKKLLVDKLVNQLPELGVVEADNCKVVEQGLMLRVKLD